MKKSYRLLALLLAFCVLAGFSGCGGAARSTDLMKGIVPQRPSLSADADTVRQQNERMTDLAVRLLQACGKSGENTLLSPLSILCALGMTENGAEVGSYSLAQLGMLENTRAEAAARMPWHTVRDIVVLA